MSFFSRIQDKVREPDNDPEDDAGLPFVKPFLPQAYNVMQRTKKHILPKDPSKDCEEGARALRDSLLPNLGTNGVAGAIIVSVALSALTLPNLNQIHWTAQAAFVFSLVCGSLSVYFSCVLQGVVSSLSGAFEMRQLLTRPRTVFRSMTPRISEEFEQARSQPSIGSLTAREFDRLHSQVDGWNEYIHKTGHRPSLSAALIITAPTQLLNMSLLALLAGFGIYFGCTWSAGLPTPKGKHSGLAVLIVYIISATCGSLLFYWPSVAKLRHIKHDKTSLKLRAEVERLAKAFTQQEAINSTTASVPSGLPPSADVGDVVSALNKVLELQSQQLQAQKSLLDALSASHQHVGSSSVDAK